MRPLIGRAGTVAAGLFGALLVAACGQQVPRGYGVVLWADSGALPTGAVVDVLEESELEDHYLVLGAGADRDQEGVAVTRWRVRVFPDAEQATAFAANYAPLGTRFGYAVRSGLPVRAEAAATADIIYQLREGQVVKVLERGAELEQVGVFENYWYRVLTEDGTEGYTFGEFLPVFESTGDAQADAARLHAADPTLERVLSTVWRPEYYRAMLRSGRYDLERFRVEYGLFPDPAAQVFKLVTEEGAHEFAYQVIERVGDNLYVLQEADALRPTRFTVQSENRVAISYQVDGRLVTQVFLDLKLDIAELIAAERARRDLLYADLLRRGTLLQSSGYGTITLAPERRYRWQGFQALVPGLLPPGLSGSGRMDFRYRPGPALASSYDTVITLLFDRSTESDTSTTSNPNLDAGDPETSLNDSAAAGAPVGERASARDDSKVAADDSAVIPDDPADNSGDPAAADPVADPAAGSTDSAATTTGADPPETGVPAAELTLLAAYDSRGIRLTPAVPDPESRQVSSVSRSAVVMYFSFAAAAPASTDG